LTSLSRASLRGIERSNSRIEAGGVKRQTADLSTQRDVAAQLKEYRATQREIRRSSIRSKKAARVPLPPDPVGEEWDQQMESIFKNAMDEL